MSRTARRAGSPRPPPRAWPGHDAKQPCWLPRAVGQASADARARPADERLTADGKRAGRKLGASCAAALDNTGRPRRARCARADHRAAVTIHSTATARSLMGLYRSPATSEAPAMAGVSSFRSDSGLLEGASIRHHSRLGTGADARRERSAFQLARHGSGVTTLPASLREHKAWVAEYELRRLETETAGS
jgi:hypothetical protein